VVISEKSFCCSAGALWKSLTYSRAFNAISMSWR
jgi:hypothetical protein